MNFQLDFIEKLVYISIKCHAGGQYPVGAVKKFLCPRRIGECRPGNGAKPHFSFACPLRNAYNQRVAKTEKSSDLMIYVPPL